ncbi:Intraflagellar transport protein 22-like [Hondaea fermentalgiana]|uniref:Intraflagellar transport protein 22-like n=1 Tax=Hondaea fermentalgiana TaxID=2315210 RepID=A0A2R5G1U7_9STRA|nr:Intraflagellar transport protein 22-like [Hondaea fermentalgiana]|eukprot:GBG24997.1 Intraflagellar transport protein 22-like [Hondaea fermentalgiana]
MAAKVLIVGPEQSGKSTIANMLAGVVSAAPHDRDEPEDISLRDQPYRATAAVRVVEFEAQLTSSQARNWGGDRSVEVEIWDTSGATKYESCWPAIQQKADGVVIVYNPENPNHLAEVETWYEWFVVKTGLKQDQCLVLANDRNSGPEDPRANPPAVLDDCELIYTDASDADKIKTAFQDLVATIGSFKE